MRERTYHVLLYILENEVSKSFKHTIGYTKTGAKVYCIHDNHVH